MGQPQNAAIGCSAPYSGIEKRSRKESSLRQNLCVLQLFDLPAVLADDRAQECNLFFQLVNATLRHKRFHHGLLICSVKFSFSYPFIKREKPDVSRLFIKTQFSDNPPLERSELSLSFSLRLSGFFPSPIIALSISS